MSKPPELTELVSELKDLRWSEVKKMAMHLTKMNMTVLDQIEENRSTQPDLFVTYAMQEWLNRDVEASWAKVVSALREIEKNTLAAKLEGKYCAPISEPPPLSQSGPQGLVSQLASSVATATVPVQSSTESSLDHSTSPSQDQTTSGSVGNSKLSTAEIQGIKNKAAKLKKKFTSVLLHTKICFTDKEEESRKFLRDFKITLTSLPLFTQHEDKEFLKEEENRIKTAKDVDEIFEILKPYWNYVDYDFLEHIVEECGTEGLQEEMKEYIAEVEQFEKKTTVQDFSLATEKEVVIPAHYRKLAVKLEKDPKMFTLHDVRLFKKSVQNESSLKEYSLLFEGVSCSSVEIVLAFPPEAYAKLSEVINAFQFSWEHKVVSVAFSVSEDTAVSLPKRQRPSLHCKGTVTPSLKSVTDMSGRGQGRGQGPRHCIEYKFLGTCEKYEKGECHFRHERKEQYTYRDYLQIPAGLSVGMVVGSGGSNLKQLYSIAQCYVKVKPEEMRVLIVTANRAKLPLLVEKMKLLMSQERTSGPSWCYIHPGGITSHGLYKFRPYSGRIPPRARSGGITIYELCSDVQESAESELVQKLAAMSPLTEDDTSTGLRTALQRVHGDIPVGAEGTKWTQRTRIHLNPKESILKTLTESLDLLCQKKREGLFVTRLDARFGKVTWGRFPEEVYSARYSIEELANLLFAKDVKHMNIFNTDVKSANADFMRSKQKSCKPYLVETFDVKVTCVDGDRLDVRLLVKRKDHGETKLRVLMVKKNEIKDVTFDILNLHRQHDVRIGLHHYQCVQDGDRLYGVVKEILGKISFPSRHGVKIETRTSRWNIHLIRHKKKLTYPLDDKFALTIADVSEHTFDVKTARESEEFDMRMETKAAHAEVELHNLSWECAFGRDMGLTPDQSLALHMERGSVDTGQFDSIPHPWNPELILRDYDDFWGHLDRLNGMLDGK